MEIYINPVPDSIHSTNALYPEGAHITDLQEVRDLLYKMQRPAISPQVGLDNNLLLLSVLDPKFLSVRVPALMVGLTCDTNRVT